MSQKFIIEGGKTLGGEIDVRGSKNATTPILAATLLTAEPCIIGNIPLIEDVFKMINLIEKLGAEVSWIEENKVKIVARDIDPKRLDRSLIAKMRSSILMLGPLFARYGAVEMNHPGGCIIGTRSVDTHLNGFRDLGADIDIFQTGETAKEGTYKYSEKTNVYSLKANPNTKEREVVLDEFSVTATENIMMAAALSPYKTIIKMAACEPHIQELGKLLLKMGVDIKGAGTHTIEIIGKEKLGGVEYLVPYDYIEAGTYILMGLAVNGEIQVNNVPIGHLELFFKKLSLFGAGIERRGEASVIIKASQKMKMSKVQALPHPGIATDLQSIFGVLATQTEGLTLIQDPLYDGRLKYLGELNKMGAEIIICDPHRAVISGPTKLYGTEVGPLDLRSGAALIIAGLIADGTSIIKNISQIDRGYERIEERLIKLGASIKRVDV